MGTVDLSDEERSKVTERARAERAAIKPFLKKNPFPGAFTDGLFFRDKMRAIHRIAPAAVTGPVLEIGGGRSGLTKLLYPRSEVTNLDLQGSFAGNAANRAPGLIFVQGDAASMPFEPESFGMVTMFDLLEHVPDDTAVARETLRVLRPGGHILVTTPHRLRWRYPSYRALQPISRNEVELMAEWGHVRRGYTEGEVEALFGLPVIARSTFVNPLLAISHDIAFSRLPKAGRLLLHALAAPASVAGYLCHDRLGAGMEIALQFRNTEHL